MKGLHAGQGDRERHVVLSGRQGRCLLQRSRRPRDRNLTGENVRREALEEFCFNGEQTFWLIAGVGLWDPRSLFWEGGRRSSYGNGQGRTGLTMAKGENPCWVLGRPWKCCWGAVGGPAWRSRALAEVGGGGRTAEGPCQWGNAVAAIELLLFSLFS